MTSTPTSAPEVGSLSAPYSSCNKDTAYTVSHRARHKFEWENQYKLYNRENTILNVYKSHTTDDLLLGLLPDGLTQLAQIGRESYILIAIGQVQIIFQRQPSVQG